ncbi:MAG TPA: group II truncated hemoglobin [Trebonia sp.]|jgi:hemoglobin|nr:group II truncated hemoglobin [Trebonia sp.]
MTSLYDDAGGLDGLQRLSVAFYDRVLADEMLAPVFAQFTRTHVERVAVWLAEVFGGPAEYTARRGGHQSLLRSHLGLEIRDEHRKRWLELMADAVSEVYPGRPELAATLMSYFDWGTAIAQDVSRDPAGTDLGAPGPTPRWGYQGLVR